MKWKTRYRFRIRIHSSSQLWARSFTNSLHTNAPPSLNSSIFSSVPHVPWFCNRPSLRVSKSSFASRIGMVRWMSDRTAGKEVQNEPVCSFWHSMQHMNDHSERNCSQKGERWSIASVSGRVCLGRRQREDKASNIAACVAALGAHPLPYVATAWDISFFQKKYVIFFLEESFLQPSFPVPPSVCEACRSLTFSF